MPLKKTNSFAAALLVVLIVVGILPISVIAWAAVQTNYTVQMTAGLAHEDSITPAGTRSIGSVALTTASASKTYELRQGSTTGNALWAYTVPSTLGMLPGPSLVNIQLVGGVPYYFCTNDAAASASLFLWPRN